MKDSIIFFFRRVDARVRRIGTHIQSAVVWVGLLVVYLVGVGGTKLFTALFFRRYLRMFRPEPNVSYWIDVSDSDPRKNLLKQT